MPKSENDHKTGAKNGKPGKEESEASAKLEKPAASKADNSSAAPDAIALLKQDHRKVDELFDAFEKADDDAQKDQLIQQICQALIIHTTLEEKIFYPASRQASTEDQLEEAQVEHDSAKFLILELLNGDSGDEYRDAKVKVLAEQIRHHVKEEEAPDGLFAKAQKAGVNTPELGERLSQLKQRLLANAQQDRLPEPEPRAYHQFSQASQHEERRRGGWHGDAQGHSEASGRG